MFKLIIYSFLIANIGLAGYQNISYHYRNRDNPSTYIFYYSQPDRDLAG